eukprot:Nitzschia sp. Nitz4//scaffold24_size164493//159880//161466//NITZ4_002357-RA/size164493-processed-gene-0.251-mRNA-1//-1//CDS//3329544201//1631//frame0
MTVSILKQFAISDDQSLVALVPPSSSSQRLLIQVYERSASSCRLQLTLSHTTLQNNGTLQELIFCGTSVLLARISDSQILVWDLNRGVLSHTVQARDDEAFEGLAANSNSDLFYVLTRQGNAPTGKYITQEYASSSCKLLRKIKSGRCGDEVMTGPGRLVINSTYVVVQLTPGVLRVMDIANGKKMGKIKCTDVSKSILTPSNQLVVASSTVAKVFDATTCQELVNIPCVSDDSVRALELVGCSLLVDDTIYSLDDSVSSCLGKSAVFQGTSSFVPMLADEGSQVSALVYQSQAGCKTQNWDIEEVPGKSPATLDVDATEPKADASAATSAKRKGTAETLRMGPGQMGMEAAPPTKRVKTQEEEEDEEDEEMNAKEASIAERLQQLTNAMEGEDEEMDEDRPNVAFKAKQATTESLKELLSQALESNEDSLLELALGVSDRKIISTTLKEMDTKWIPMLLSKLTSRIASNPFRAEHLAVWLSQCLRLGASQISAQQLAPLRNLLSERIESFSDLLRLEGRLSILCDVE